MNLELFYPVRNFKINQGFAENRACSNPDTSGVENEVTIGVCPEGKVHLYPLLGLPNGHNGLDIRAGLWEPVYASQEGIVREKQTEINRGLGVSVVTEKKYKVNDLVEECLIKHRYWHLIAINVEERQRVRAGDLIGWADSTGYSSGHHLHFEVKPVVWDMFDYKNILQNNGFYGCIDPKPYLNGLYGMDILPALDRLREAVAQLAEKIAEYIRIKGR